MGLAASQGRLLLLTAKKSDLEFRAQAISQSRLILMQQQEGIATKYAEKTSNRCYKLKYNDGNGDKDAPLTWDNINSHASEILRFRDKDGNALSGEVIKKLKGDKDGKPDGYTQYAINAGIVKIQKQENGEWTDTSVAGDTSLSDEYYEVDNEPAKSAYDAEMLKVKIKDQRLELDLKGIETQHKAVETETESVQKIIQKNIEVSFKIFS